MSQDIPPDQANKDRAAAIVRKLRAGGQRLTPQRLAIIRNFVGRGDHPSAEAVFSDLCAEFPMMAMSTVYNTLRTLVRLGEAVEVSPATPEARFDPNTGDHCHLVCLGCMSITDVPLERCVPELPAEAAGVAEGFAPVLHVHQILGYCAECRQSESGNE